MEIWPAASIHVPPGQYCKLPYIGLAIFYLQLCFVISLSFHTINLIYQVTGAESGDDEGASGDEGASSGAKRRMVASFGRSDKDSWGAEEADVRRKQVTGAASGDKSAASSGSRKRMDGSLAGKSHDKDKDAEEADVRRKQVSGAESGDEGVSQLVPPVKHKKMVTLRTVSLLYRHQC